MCNFWVQGRNIFVKRLQRVKNENNASNNSTVKKVMDTDRQTIAKISYFKQF